MARRYFARCATGRRLDRRSRNRGDPM